MTKIYNFSDVQVQANRGGYTGGLVLRDEAFQNLRHLHSGKPVDSFIEGLDYREFEHEEVFYAGLVGRSFGHIMAEFVHRLLYAKDFQIPILVVVSKPIQTMAKVDNTFKQVLNYFGISEDRILLLTEDVKVKTVFTVKQQSCLKGGIDNLSYIEDLTQYSVIAIRINKNTLH
jgi:hypothetical protein